MTLTPRTDRQSASSWPRGFPRPCLLLLIAERPSHGYDLLDRLDGLGAPAIDAATLYRSLRAMERDRIVRSRWETASAGPARRIYAITPAGREELRHWAETLSDSRRVLAAYLDRYEALGEPADRPRR